jgi:hypothetical protein
MFRGFLQSLREHSMILATYLQIFSNISRPSIQHGLDTEVYK